MTSASACMRGAIACAAFAAFTAIAQAEPQEKMTFTVMRNDAQIGTNTITLGRNGLQVTVESVTHVTVGMAFITLYRFDQRETEQWQNGRLLALNAVTDDNGTVHRIAADSRDGKIVVTSDGLVKEVAATILPASAWNSDILRQDVALDPESGNLVPVSIVDRGEENVVVGGRSTLAHHYVIKTAHSQDVWYDQNHALVKVEIQGSDGSTIRYQLIS